MDPKHLENTQNEDVPLNLTEESQARYKSAAHREEKNLSKEWMREKLDAACEALGIAVGQKAAPPSMFRRRNSRPITMKSKNPEGCGESSLLQGTGHS